VSEPDYLGLRADVEAATRLPEFSAVERRARRYRFRDRAAVAGAVVTTFAVLTPVAVAALTGRPAALLVRPDPPAVESASPSPSSPAPVVRVRAAAGTDLDHVYVAVDVCSGPVCSLQVAPVTPHSAGIPVVIGQLRASPTQPVSDVQLTPLTSRSLLLSGQVPGQGRKYARISVTGGATVAAAPTSVSELRPGDRAVQLSEGGEVYAIRQDDDRITRVETQPPLSNPAVATGVAPDRGWWATGIDPATGGLAVSVSRDQGRTWLTGRVDVQAVGETVVASVDGQTAYLAARTAAGGLVARTADGGRTWHVVSPTLPWRPSSPDVRIGMIVRPDGSVLAWLADEPAPVYLESTDGGQTFHGTSGPGTAIVSTPGGYLVLGQPVSVSRDARTWSALPPVAYLAPQN
jgi:hypothetical protein